MKKLLTILSLFLFVLHANAQRNVILIIADDLGTDYFGFYEDHQDTVDVPNIRGLLKKGIRFKNATANPVCSATRSTILTGRYGFRTGVGNIVGGTGGSGVLDTAEKSIPKLLKAFNPNIAKANIGKWHLNNPMPVANLQAPLKLGYDHYEGPFIGQLTSYTNWTKYTNGVSSTVTTYATTENVNNALTWLQAQNGKQFFMWLAFNAPHSPYHLPPANLHSYTLSGTTQDINQNPKKYFKAMLQAMDTEIGRFMDSLKARNQYDSTDFIFIGDNGNTQQTAQIANLNKAKGTIYEYGVHVPFIISGPSVVNPNRTSDALVNVADIFATVQELYGNMNWQAQIPANKPVDTKSLLPIIKDQATSIRPWAFCENFKTTPDSLDGKAMRNAEYKLIRFTSPAKEEFYNLAIDPLENTNLLLDLSAMTSAEISNYYYLCGEMATLLSNPNFCATHVNIDNQLFLSKHIFPNPFSTHIYLSPEMENEYFELRNSVGQIIYEGKEIQKQDFSSLSKGLYTLKNVNIPQQVLKLMKN